MASPSPDEELADLLAEFYADPLGHVIFSYPWDTEKSIQLVDWYSDDLKTLIPVENNDKKVSVWDLMEPYRKRFPNVRFGPDWWACDFLDEVGREVKKRGFDGRKAVAPIQMATLSGHGIGKSVIVAWLIKWILDTRPLSKGIVTAGTADQLRTKTWAEVGKWHKMSLTSHWFDYSSGRGSMSLAANRTDARGQSLKEQWRCDAQTCREENSDAFAGLHAANATPFYIFDEGCHDDQTEVMTETGWKPFAALASADRLLTPEGWQTPSHLHVAHRKGTMLSIEKRGLSLCVTPNHDMYGRSQKGVLKKVQAQDVSESGLIAPRTVEWSAPDVGVTDDEIQLAAWYYSEGHLISNTYECKVREQKAPEFFGFGITNNVDHGISDLLDRLGLKWSKNGNQWLVYDRERAAAFAQRGRTCLDKAPPTEMLALSQRQLRVFLDIYATGDGYRHRQQTILYTSSRKMADVLHAMAVLAGYNASLTRRALAGKRSWIKDHWATSSADGWVVSLSETGEGAHLKRSVFKPIEYDGMVYCATVPAGLLLTRRNGTVLWSGNSAVPDKIYEVREGGTTDGEPMTFDFGNPVRNSGRLFEEAEGKLRHRYIVRHIDSRTVQITNKERIQQWIDDFGEDSDFVKVRVRGRFPSAGSLQFIPTADVEEAMRRPLFLDRSAPLIIGVDVARFGDDESVIYPRLGKDARSWAPIPGKGRYRGLDTVQLVGKVIETVRNFRQLGKQVSALFVDGGGVGGGVVDQLRNLGYNPIEVQFGGGATDKTTYRYKSDEMWGNLRDDLKAGLILPGDDNETGGVLKEQLTQREYGYTKQGNKVHLEAKEDMKKRLGGDFASPDVADALACTYAQEVVALADTFAGQPLFAQHEYDPQVDKVN